jgi:hypothetical protein
MSRPHWILPALIPLALCLLAGCGRTTIKQPPEHKQAGEDALVLAREQARRASDVDGYRTALSRVNDYLTQHPEALARYQPSAKDRPLLEKALQGPKAGDRSQLSDTALARLVLEEWVGLQQDELREVESPRFNPLDAHYLEFCATLRDAARKLILQEQGKGEANLSSARLPQVRRSFDWVIRQVALEEKGVPLRPPEFALRSGRGGSRERILVFVALLRQMGLEGCAIAVPGPGKEGPRYVLAGVLLKGAGKPAIYLFDPRLGIPLPGPGGKGVATLAQLRQQPAKILAALNLDKTFTYDLDEKQAVQARPYLVLPLSGLSVRMRFLEDEVFAADDPVALALRPERLRARFEEAESGEVGVWNGRAVADRAPPLTPTRVLRLSLPPDHGGIDQPPDKETPSRYARHLAGLMPWPAVVAVLREMKITDELEGLAGSAQITGYIFDLYRKYIQTPREMLLRGRTDEASKRLVRLRTVLDQYEEELGRLGEERFAAELARWRKRVREAALEKARAGASKAWDAVWLEDQYLLSVLAPGEEEADRRKMRTGMLGFVVFRAAGPTLRREAAYLLALRLHNEASRQQGRADAAGDGKVGQKLGGEVTSAWTTAQERWGHYAHDYPVSEPTLASRAQLIRQQANNVADLQALGESLGHVFHDLRRTLAARLREAEAAGQVGQPKAARLALESLAQQADAVHASKALRDLRLDFNPAPEVDALLFGDLVERGTFFWLRYRARLELAKPAR